MEVWTNKQTDCKYTMNQWYLIGQIPSRFFFNYWFPTVQSIFRKTSFTEELITTGNTSEDLSNQSVQAFSDMGLVRQSSLMLHQRKKCPRTWHQLVEETRKAVSYGLTYIYYVVIIDQYYCGSIKLFELARSELIVLQEILILTKFQSFSWNLWVALLI